MLNTSGLILHLTEKAQTCIVPHWCNKRCTVYIHTSRIIAIWYDLLHSAVGSGVSSSSCFPFMLNNLDLHASTYACTPKYFTEMDIGYSVYLCRYPTNSNVITGLLYYVSIQTKGSCVMLQGCFVTRLAA